MKSLTIAKNVLKPFLLACMIVLGNLLPPPPLEALVAPLFRGPGRGGEGGGMPQDQKQTCFLHSKPASIFYVLNYTFVAGKSELQ